MRTILVVEDERIVAKDLQRTLIGLGYSVPATAASAADAIRLASERCPDLVLMDIQIKGDRDGIQTAQILRRDFDVPVVYLTAYSDDATLARVKSTDPFGYLVKPVMVGELRSTVEIALHKHQMERNLRTREHLVSTTLRSIGDAVIATDPAGNVTFMNGIAELLTGQRLENAAGQRLDDVLRLVDELTGDPIDNPVIKALRDGKIGPAPLHTAVKIETGRRSIDEITTPIIDDHGQTLGAVLVFRDVTEDREAQHQMVVADRLSSLGTMAAGVAHEINNPLNVVVANAAMASQQIVELRRGVASQAIAGDELGRRLVDLEAMLADIRHSADRVASIVGDLRTFSRAPNDGPIPVDVRHAIEWAVRITDNQVQPQGMLIRDLAPVPHVAATEVRLGQVFVNLIVNAVHALRESPRERKEIRIATRYEAERVVISVSDNGVGMTSATCARIFEPFFTTKSAGSARSGLGLAVAHGIVRSLDGEITVESEPGRGTCFKVSLPPALTAVALPGAQTALAPSLIRTRIAVIDDEPLLLNSIKQILLRDHDVLAFLDPREALETLLARNDIDMVLCDLHMPGVDGMQIYERLLHHTPGLADRMAFVTGGAFTKRSRAFLTSIKNPCLEKPFGPDRLRAFIHDFLASVAQVS